MTDSLPTPKIEDCYGFRKGTTAIKISVGNCSLMTYDNLVSGPMGMITIEEYEQIIEPQYMTANRKLLIQFTKDYIKLNSSKSAQSTIQD